MTAVRKLVDSNTLAGIFDLPPAFKGKKIEVILLPADDSSKESPAVQNGVPYFTAAQIEEWAKAPEIQNLAGVLKKANLPTDISITDIRDERLTEKYTA